MRRSPRHCMNASVGVLARQVPLVGDTAEVGLWSYHLKRDRVHDAGRRCCLRAKRYERSWHLRSCGAMRSTGSHAFVQRKERRCELRVATWTRTRPSAPVIVLGAIGSTARFWPRRDGGFDGCASERWCALAAYPSGWPFSAGSAAGTPLPHSRLRRPAAYDDNECPLIRPIASTSSLLFW